MCIKRMKGKFIQCLGEDREGTRLHDMVVDRASYKVSKPKINPGSGLTRDFKRGSCHLLYWCSALKGKRNDR